MYLFSVYLFIYILEINFSINIFDLPYVLLLFIF